MTRQELKQKLAEMSEEELRKFVEEYFTEQPKPQPKANEFNYEEFAQEFVKDPAAAIDKAFAAKIGVPLTASLPTLAQAVAALINRVQELEAEAFLDDHPEFDPTEENIAVLEEIMTERNWQPGRQAYEDALRIAYQTGRIKPKEDTKEVPPKLPAGQSTVQEEEVTEELLEQVSKMTDDELEQFLRKKGILK